MAVGGSDECGPGCLDEGGQVEWGRGGCLIEGGGRAARGDIGVIGEWDEGKDEKGAVQVEEEHDCH